MRFRFTIRDLLWLMALLGVCFAWWLDHHKLTDGWVDDFPRWQNKYPDKYIDHTKVHLADPAPADPQ